MTDAKRNGLEDLRRKMNRGFGIEAVDSTDANLIVTLERGTEVRQVRLDREAARELLAGDLDRLDPIPA